MANQEHVKLIKKDRHEWNEWRKNNPTISPSLKGAELRGENLSGKDLRKVDLSRADLRNADLHVANIRGADLSRARLTNANLEGANLSNANLAEADFYKANLRDADLTNTNCFQVNFKNADLFRTNLSRSNLKEANLMATQALETNFSDSNLTAACIEDLQTNHKTNLDNVVCDYVYRKNYQQERRPSNPNQNFKIGEFFTLIQEIHATVELIFTNGVDWLILLTSINEFKITKSINDLPIQAIEHKRDGRFVVRIDVPTGIDEAECEKFIQRDYESKETLSEEKHLKKITSKNDSPDIIAIYEQEIAYYRKTGSDLMEVVKHLAKSSPSQITIINSNTQHGEMMVDNKNQNIQIKGDNFGVAGDGNIQLVKGNISKVIGQLQESEDSSDHQLAEYLQKLRVEVEKPETGLNEKDRQRALKHIDALAQLATDKKNPNLLEKASDAIDILPSIIKKGEGLIEFAEKHLPTITAGIRILLGLGG
jgi:hypothetical protein